MTDYRRWAAGLLCLAWTLTTGPAAAGATGTLLPAAEEAAAESAAAGDSMATVSTLRAGALYGPLEGATGVAGDALGRPRSIPLAFGLSAVLPGAGQAYNGHWIKAALAVAVEGALALGYVTWQRQGLDGEEAYQDYAHAYWSPARYAAWLETYTGYLNDQYGAQITIPDLAPPPGIDFTNPSAWSAGDREAVKNFFRRMRGLEDKLYHPTTGASFSHNLPFFGEQQYYELIGKYFQFAPGWDDYPLWTGNPDAFDPEAVGPDGEKIFVQGRFWDYDDRHTHANDLLRRASRATALILVNHLVAAIDAAVFAKLHNERLSARMEMTYDTDGAPRPAAVLRARF